MAKTVVIFLNGKPRAGKDTFIGFAHDRLKSLEIPCVELSSIQCVKDMVNYLNIDISEKNEADRAMLSEIGDSIEKHSNFKSMECIRTIIHYMGLPNPNVVFLHVREKEMIDFIIKHFDGNDKVKFIKAVLESNRSENVISNTADNGVYDIKYDYTLTNFGSLSDLDNVAGTFVNDVILPEIKHA